MIHDRFPSIRWARAYLKDVYFRRTVPMPILLRTVGPGENRFLALRGTFDVFGNIQIPSMQRSATLAHKEPHPVTNQSAVKAHILCQPMIYPH